MSKYFVSDDCIECNMCNVVSPNNFLINEDQGKAFVYKQPESSEEISLCDEAIESCPVEAISKELETSK